MVRAGGHPGDLCAVFSCSRPTPRARADNEARSRGRYGGMVYETDAARSSARLRLCLSASPQEKVAADLRAHIAGGDTGFLPAASVQPQLRGQSRRLVRAEPY